MVDVDCQMSDASLMKNDIVLYGNRPVTSPYVMSVFVALNEKGLDFQFELLDLGAGEQHTSEYVARSVTNRVPTLKIEGEYLSESSAITEFLEERFAPGKFPRLYPADLHERARVRMAQALIRSDFMPIRVERSTETIFQNAAIAPLSPEALESKARLERIALALLTHGSGYVASEFSIADVDLATLLQRLVANGDNISPLLIEYANRIWQRPSVTKWLALTKYQGPRS